MQVLLPQLYQRFASVMEDSSEMSVEIQKQILKIFFALIQVSENQQLKIVHLECSVGKNVSNVID